MTTLYIASSEPFSGKSLVGLALALIFQRQGRLVSYFKPLGVLPTKVSDVLTDEDAAFIHQVLHLDQPLCSVCPVVLTDDLIQQALRGTLESAGLEKLVTDSYRAAADGNDLVLAGGAGSVLSTGSLVGLPAVRVVELLDCPVLLVAKYSSRSTLDGILSAQRLLGGRLLGTILNDVRRGQMEEVRGSVIPFLEGKGIRVVGVLPRDRVLSSVTVRELADLLSARVLCCPEVLEQPVEHFSVGAMSQESALRYFRRIPAKAVITGGDRADIQSAALDTSTTALVLTGDLYPDPRILTRAEEQGVAVLLVREDTLTAVERIDDLVGKLRVREPRKIERAVELLTQHADLERLAGLIGLS